ncbi:MAG TPA: gliding motility-associated C-terminal domain-containing protein [Flavobacteriales bacterium]|nr:gliding motility-associated C-terminal domain-containing protein [Flavobacteriales bacterium]
MKCLSFLFKKGALLLAAFLYVNNFFAQSIIMNEVSNGPSGNKEYVEFVVVDTAAFYDCTGSTPPCIDIRGWIFDDNSGYHGSSGVAAGAVRFSYNALWSCVPLGTIILIYNDADANADIPAMDLTMADGNCRIVAPISNTSLFETNVTTPGAVACSYPSTGWTPGGLWSSTLLANPGDCARIVNLAGCEVFSVCWGSCSTSTLIYFSSGGSGTDNVWYFNDGDPNDQVNWSEGCTDPTSCGSNEQTPGSANNPANAAYIAQFNNNCSPITLLTSTITAFTDAGCTCDGTATVTPAGSIPGYTYTWYDAAYNPIGQYDSTATGLCAGTYHVISTSLIGCDDTATVIISATGVGTVVNVSASPSASICSGDATVLTATGAVSYTWLPATGLSATTGSSVSASPTTTTTFIVTGTAGSGCSDTTSITIIVNANPVINIPPVPAVCEDLSPFLVGATPSGGSWTGTGITTGGMFNPAGLGGTSSTITYTVTNASGCTASASTTISVSANPVINITPPPALCDEGSPVALAATPAGGTWSGTGITSAVSGTFDPSVSGIGTFVVNYTATSGACTETSSINITVNSGSAVVIDPVSNVCENAAAFTLTASPGGGFWGGIGVSSTGIFNPTATGNGSFAVTYTIAGAGLCKSSDTLIIIVDDLPVINVVPVSTLCSDAPDFNLVATPTGGSWSGTGITNAGLGTFSPLSSGIGTFAVTYTVISGACTAISTVNIDVVPATNLVISGGPLTFCEGDSVVLNATGAMGSLVTWSTGETGNSLTVHNSGNYFAMVNSGCGIDSSNTLAVDVNVVDISFTIDPLTGMAPLTVTLTNTTPNTLSYTWHIDTLFIANADTSFIYNEQGTYAITLYVVSTDGCIDSLTQAVFVYGESGITIPNVFTPNADSYNDVFSIIIKGISDLSVEVFNRWGQLMHGYTGSELSDGTIPVWDGSSNGDRASDGTYAYVIKTHSYGGVDQTFKGFLTLVTR